MSRKTYSPNANIIDSDKTLVYGFNIRRSLTTDTVTIGTDATKIPTSPLSNRSILIIVNISANIIYIGNSSVTTADGFPLYQRQSMQIEVEDDVDVYGIASGASEIRILEGS